MKDPLPHVVAQFCISGLLWFVYAAAVLLAIPSLSLVLLAKWIEVRR